MKGFTYSFFFTVWVEAFQFLKFSKYPTIGIMVSVKKFAQGKKYQILELAVLPSLETQKRKQIKYFKAYLLLDGYTSLLPCFCIFHDML